MRIVLRNTKTSLYYAGLGRWVSDPAAALDFEDAGRAAEFARQAKPGELRIFLHYQGGTKAYREPEHHTAHRRS